MGQIVNILGSLGPLVSHMISSAAAVGEQPQTVVNDWLWLFMKTTFTKTAWVCQPLIEHNVELLSKCKWQSLPAIPSPSPEGVTKPGTERITKAAVVFPLLCLFQTWSPCLRCCLFHLPKCYLGGLSSQLLVLSSCFELFWHAVCMSHWQVLWYLCVHGFRAPSKFPEHKMSGTMLCVLWGPRSGCQHPVQARLLYPPGRDCPWGISRIDMCSE